VPLPDRVIYVRAPLEVLVNRAMRRADRRRELAADDRKEVERWIARAQEVFDGLAVAPAIRDRLLTVDHVDDSPGTQRAVVEQILAFINGHNRTDRSRGGPVSSDPSRTSAHAAARIALRKPE
jgi:thymidylate kinase